MGRRREEKVDEEELARLMGNVEGESSKIRVKMPNTKVNEMFAIAEQSWVAAELRYCVLMAKPEWLGFRVKCEGVNGFVKVI